MPEPVVATPELIDAFLPQYRENDATFKRELQHVKKWRKRQKAVRAKAWARVEATRLKLMGEANKKAQLMERHIHPHLSAKIARERWLRTRIRIDLELGKITPADIKPSTTTKTNEQEDHDQTQAEAPVANSGT